MALAFGRGHGVSGVDWAIRKTALGWPFTRMGNVTRTWSIMRRVEQLRQTCIHLHLVGEHPPLSFLLLLLWSGRVAPTDPGCGGRSHNQRKPWKLVFFCTGCIAPISAVHHRKSVVVPPSGAFLNFRKSWGPSRALPRAAVASICADLSETLIVQWSGPHGRISGL